MIWSATRNAPKPPSAGIWRARFESVDRNHGSGGRGWGGIAAALGAIGFLAAEGVLFAVHAGINVATGFDGALIEESLILFNGQWSAYFAFNLQITYRAFALSVLALAVVFITRLHRGHA